MPNETIDLCDSDSDSDSNSVSISVVVSDSDSDSDSNSDLDTVSRYLNPHSRSGSGKHERLSPVATSFCKRPKKMLLSPQSSSFPPVDYSSSSILSSKIHAVDSTDDSLEINLSKKVPDKKGNRSSLTPEFSTEENSTLLLLNNRKNALGNHDICLKKSYQSIHSTSDESEDSHLKSPPQRRALSVGLSSHRETLLSSEEENEEDKYSFDAEKPENDTNHTIEVDEYANTTKQSDNKIGTFVSRLTKTATGPCVPTALQNSIDTDDDSDDSFLFSPGPFNRNKNLLSRNQSKKSNTSKKPLAISSSSNTCMSVPMMPSHQYKTPRHKSKRKEVLGFVPTESSTSTIEKAIPFTCDDYGSSDLLSPQHSNLTPCNSSTKNKKSTETVGTPMKPTPALPIIQVIGGKQYPDLRHQFIKSLIHHARLTRRAIYQRGALDASLRAIVIFSLHPYPIRTAKAATRIKGIGSELMTVLKAAEENKNAPYCPPKGKFSSVGAAGLVALLEYEQEKHEGNICPMEDLIQRINRLTHHSGQSNALSKGVDFYLCKDNLDPGWGQVRKLCNKNISAGHEPMIKERKNKKLCTSGIGYELLETGKKIAEALKTSLSESHSSEGPLRQLASHTVDERYGNVTMVMDYREGGGNSKGLHKMCDLLDEYRVPFAVRELKISDYVFFVGNKLAPILIERKSVDDVANSLADGRWERQQRSMRKAQYVLGNGDKRKCQLCYLIEGDASRRIVHGGNVGRVSWDQSLEAVENAIEELPSLGFSVMRTKSIMGSMNILSQVARDVEWKASNKSISCTFSYDEFIRETKKCSKSKGDPPTAAEHQYPAAPIADAVATPFENREPIRHQVSYDSQNDDKENESDTQITNDKIEELKKVSMVELKRMCKDRDEKMTGKKSELISRLMKKRKPEILLTRSRQGQYVPKVPSCNAAILVAILLNQSSSPNGLTKDNIMMLAEETGISKDAMGGNGGWYNGWAGIKELMKGDPALLYESKKKYYLTTQPQGSAGVDVASALHVLAHQEKICRCTNHPSF